MAVKGHLTQGRPAGRGFIGEADIKCVMLLGTHMQDVSEHLLLDHTWTIGLIYGSGGNLYNLT